VAGRSAVRARPAARRVQVLAGRPHRLPRLCATAGGYSLHAGVVIRARDRAGLKRLAGYIARPPLAKSRLDVLPDGRVRLGLKRAWSDGTTAHVLTAEELVERLVALVPPPRANQVLYGGVLASRHRWHRAVRPRPPRRRRPPPGVGLRLTRAPRGRSRHVPWSTLLWRTFDVIGAACPTCGRVMELRAVVRGPDWYSAVPLQERSVEWQEYLDEARHYQEQRGRVQADCERELAAALAVHRRDDWTGPTDFDDAWDGRTSTHGARTRPVSTPKRPSNHDSLRPRATRNLRPKSLRRRLPSMLRPSPKRVNQRYASLSTATPPYATALRALDQWRQLALLETLVVQDPAPAYSLLLRSMFALAEEQLRLSLCHDLATQWTAAREAVVAELWPTAQSTLSKVLENRYPITWSILAFWLHGLERSRQTGPDRLRRAEGLSLDSAAAAELSKVFQQYKGLRNELMHGSGSPVGSGEYETACTSLLGTHSVRDLCNSEPSDGGLSAILSAQCQRTHVLSALVELGVVDKRDRGGCLWVELPTDLLPGPGQTIAGFTRPTSEKAIKKRPSEVFSKAEGASEDLRRELFFSLLA